MCARVLVTCIMRDSPRPGMMELMTVWNTAYLGSTALRIAAATLSMGTFAWIAVIMSAQQRVRLRHGIPSKAARRPDILLQHRIAHTFGARAPSYSRPSPLCRAVASLNDAFTSAARRA